MRRQTIILLQKFEKIELYVEKSRLQFYMLQQASGQVPVSQDKLNMQNADSLILVCQQDFPVLNWTQATRLIECVVRHFLRRVVQAKQ